MAGLYHASMRSTADRRSGVGRLASTRERAGGSTSCRLLQSAEGLRARPEHRAATALTVIAGYQRKGKLPLAGLVVGFQDEQLALAPHSGEGAPMEGAWAP